MTAPAEEGDRAEYETCRRPDCPAHREGTHHAHLARVVRSADAETDWESFVASDGFPSIRMKSGADATPPLRNAAPAVPDVRA
jgi:hypothetical protein